MSRRVQHLRMLQLMPTVESKRTPRDAVTHAFAALKSRDYRALAELCDPISLRAFKAEMVEEYCGQYDAAAEDASRAGPAIELTDEQYEEWGKYLDPVRRLKTEFPDLSTVEELSAMAPVDVFASWLTAQSYDRFLDEHSSKKPWESGDSDWRGESSERRHNAWPDYQIIGCVYDSSDIAHVLYRNRLSAAEAAVGYNDWLLHAPVEYREFMTAMHHRGDPIRVTCRRQSDGSWRLIAKRPFMLFGSLQIIELRSDD